ncbi:hypothetical protein, partial [Streptomyces brasiliscabiei]|uniref:hypothetical protein n=1 Tax=Streptomyces brasiliscabiei TaxID=2736302 RepID=UPI003014A518
RASMRAIGRHHRPPRRGCNDRDHLAARVIARARERDSLDAGIALRWKEITHTSIGAAGMNEYL